MLNIEQDDSRDTVTIESIVFSQEVFRQLCDFLPLGQPFALVSRDNGVLTVKRLYGVNASPAPDSEPFDRWRKELRACLVQLLYVAHESKSPAECKAHPYYSSVMKLIDGGPSLAVIDGALRIAGAAGPLGDPDIAGVDVPEGGKR